MNPFYRDMGFADRDRRSPQGVGRRSPRWPGVGLGGVVVGARFGLMKALVIGAFAAPISNLMFAWLATSGHDTRMRCSPRHRRRQHRRRRRRHLPDRLHVQPDHARASPATQYALFSSLYALLGKLIASQSGRIVEACRGGGRRTAG